MQQSCGSGFIESGSSISSETGSMFLCLWDIFALLDPDTDPGTPLNPDPDTDPDTNPDPTALVCRYRLKELSIVTLEERRHQMDMLQTYKILSGKKKVDPSCWFTMASDSERVTRQSADPMNIRPGAPRLDIRRYFYSQRVVDSWNSVPHDIKKSVYVNAFKNAYRRHRDAMLAPA